MLKSSFLRAAAQPSQSDAALFILLQPCRRTNIAYQGQALRPLGFPLYRPAKRAIPVALKALRKHPMGPQARPRLKPYASYLLQNEAPFVEQPIAIASAPMLSKLRPQWLSQ